MSTTKIRLFTVLALVFLFNFCFWNEKMGVNTLLFGLALLAALVWQFPKSRYSKGFLATGVSTILSAVFIIWHNSDGSKFAFIISAMCAAGFAQQDNYRHILNAWIQYINSTIFMLGAFFRSLRRGATDQQAKPVKSVRGGSRLGVIPIFILIFFYILYYVSNKQFAALSDRFWGQVGRLFAFDISFDRILFVIFALFLCGGAIWPYESGLNEQTPDDMVRTRPKRGTLSFRTPVLGLAQEFSQSKMLLWLLCALLLVVNLTDIAYVWFGVDEKALLDLQSYVHGGTYVLIFSIMLAMGVLFYVFRKNLNFYPENQTLKNASAGWLAMNGILAFSLAIRTGRYIDYHGLASKRIGVLLFLLLVFFGLYTLWQKIRDRRTMFWLWRNSGWAFFILILLNASVSWDTVVTRYNLSGKPRGNIDMNHLLRSVSDKNLYILEEKKSGLHRIMAYPAIDSSNIAEALRYKRQYFETTQDGFTWKSWNYADQRNKKEYK